MYKRQVEPSDLIYSRTLYAYIVPLASDASIASMSASVPATAPVRSAECVEVQYWSYTDASPDAMVPVRAVTARLDDPFDYSYDQNKDDDPSNDRLPMRAAGWRDFWGTELFDGGWTETAGRVPTVWDLADAAGWDGTGPIRVYAELELRQIKATYVGNGYEDYNALEEIVYVNWFSLSLIHI